MIDIHCHILPDIDDGPDNWNTSIEIAKKALSENIKNIVATPHWIKGTNWETDSKEVIDKTNTLNELLDRENIKLKVFPGMEAAITDGIVDHIRNGEVLTLAGTNCLLLDMPYGSLPYGINIIFKELVSNNIFPIIAHPERNTDFQSNPNIIKKFIDIGAMVQVTSSSFIGNFGNEAKNCALDFSKMNVIDFIATDAHSLHKRPPLIKEALQIWKKYSKGNIEKLIEESYKKLGIDRMVNI
ncbi:MAG: tyrosine-protein phosphatase [Thermodesulfobacteriota bacterium]